MKGLQLGTFQRATFYSDLSEAHQLENRFGNFCVTNDADCIGYETTQANGSDTRFDVVLKYVDGTKQTFELKQDKLVSKYKNVAVEFERTMKDGTVKPTCISVSEADWWVYYFDEHLHFIKTNDLRLLIQEQIQYITIKHNAGEGNRASIYAIPKHIFVNACHKIKLT